MTDLIYLRTRQTHSLENAARAACPESAYAHRALAAGYARRIEHGVIEEQTSLD